MISKKFKPDKHAGFTIIEVIIVLAVAGLIIVIVFLTVPALQRNSRNNLIRHDAASILAAVNNFISDNQGLLPSVGGVTCSNGTVSITGPAGTSEREINVSPGTECYTDTTVPPSTTLGTVTIGLGYGCDEDNQFEFAANKIAAGFRIENTQSGDAAQCIEG